MYDIDSARFCVIGPGRLGSALVANLVRAGLDVTAVGVRATAGTDPSSRPPRLTLNQAVAGADVLWFTVPDDAIAAAAATAAAALQTAHAQAPAGSLLAIHSSGLGSLALLAPLRAAGAEVLCLHPLQTFAGGEPQQDALVGVPLAVTGEGRAAAAGRRLAERLGALPFALPEANKPLYHMAAAVASNLLVALESEAAELMRAASGARDGLQLLGPLVRTTVENLLAQGVEQALTGPVARGDVSTVRAHLALIHSQPPRCRRGLPGSLRPSRRTRGAAARRRDGAHVSQAVRRRGATVKPVRTIGEARTALAALPRPLGLVPTMGALHEGHLALVRAARERCATVAASLFVNPTQFGPGEDFARYPRDEQRDLALFAGHGVDLVFAPRADDMYPEGFATTVHVGGPLTEAFEGAARASHFDGVATIVTKLLTIVAPDLAFFGQKDAQQLAVIRRLVADLDLPVEIVAVETVREPDGLALSSRNVYLDESQRAGAPRLHEALLAGRAAATAGASPADVAAVVTTALAPATPAVSRPGFAVKYVAVVDAATFRRERALGPRSLLVAAARLGTTRLIDNISLAVAAPGELQPISETGAYLTEDATAGKEGH